MGDVVSEYFGRISIISQAAPMAQEITGVTAAVAAGMVGIISIANGGGRFPGAWFSDLVCCNLINC
jgi:MFS transporter, OFA family, oxalate/formate antiporter